MSDAPVPFWAICILRAMIVFAYAMGLAPWPLLGLTGYWGFAIIGLVFGVALVALWPKARRDWNFQ